MEQIITIADKLSKKQDRYDIAYLKMARIMSELSYAKRLQVGAILVRDNQIISEGYNGTPSGVDNAAEDENNNTHWYTIHAEENVILKAAKNGSPTNGSTLYITHSPCQNCCKLILQSGIKRVVYIDQFRNIDGLLFLQNLGIELIQKNI